MKWCWCFHGGRILEIWQRWESTKSLDNDVLQELASGWKQMVLLQVSCKGNMKNWLLITEEKRKSIGHQVMTLTESLNAHCTNIASRFHYERRGVCCFLSEDWSIFPVSVFFYLWQPTWMIDRLVNPAYL